MVNKSVTIAGGFRDNGNVYATLDGEKHSRIMIISANVTLKGITFVNGNASDWGSDYNAEGGAIYVNSYNNLSVVNCTFNNNTAQANGGAIGKGSHVFLSCEDCIFNFNHADMYGGAMSGGSAVNCVFSNNSAGRDGGAMLGGSADSCIFKTGNDTTVVVSVSNPVFGVFNYTSAYNSGERLRFNLTSDNGLPILNRNIVVDIFKDNGKIGTFNCLSGEALSITLDAGSYVAVCRASDYGINPVNLTLTITKANSKIVASPITVTYNSNRYLTVTLRDERNNPVSGADLSININGIKKFITDKNGQIKVPTNNLAPKKYAVKITVVDSNYLKSESSVKLTVKKAASKITAKKKTFKKLSKVKKYTVTLKSGKTPIKKVKVTLKIAKKTFKAKTNNKGKAVFKVKLGAGKYKATVKFNGNKYYNKSTGKVTITVK